MCVFQYKNLNVMVTEVCLLVSCAVAKSALRLETVQHNLHSTALHRSVYPEGSLLFIRNASQRPFHGCSSGWKNNNIFIKCH